MTGPSCIDSKYFEDHFSTCSRSPTSSSGDEIKFNSTPCSSSSPTKVPYTSSSKPGLKKHDLDYQIRTPIYRVVLTGGPCAGKTTAISEVAERLRQRGIRVYVIPEVATLLFTGGATIPKTPARTLAFQLSLLRAQIALEDSFYRIAESTNEPSLLLCDRGTMDGRAYMDGKMWERLVEKFGGDSGEEGLVKLRDDRYELICHLITAAENAEEFYGCENNECRYESGSEARDVDVKLRNAWVGHPHLRIVDNRTGFKQKIERVYSHVASLFGIVERNEEVCGGLGKLVKKKFLVKSGEETVWKGGAGPRGVEIKEFFVEQTFLLRGSNEEGLQESVRRRGKGGFFTFVHQVRRKVSAWVDLEDEGGEVVEMKRQITNREYLSLLGQADPARRTVRIKRQCFLYKGQYFVLDTPLDIRPQVQLLRTRVESDVADLEFPSWIQVEREVSGQVEWTMHALSMRVDQSRAFESWGPGSAPCSTNSMWEECLGTSI